MTDDLELVIIPKNKEDHEFELVNSSKKDILIASLLKYLYDNEFDKDDIDKDRYYDDMIKNLELNGLLQRKIISNDEKEFDIIRDSLLDTIKDIVLKQKNNKFHISYKNKENKISIKNKPLYRNFKVIRELENGAYGTIYEVKSLIDEKLYALKETEYDKCFDKKWNLEMKVMSILNNENIIKYHSSWIDFGFINSDKIYLYIQMELCDTDLSKLLCQYSYVERKLHIHTLFKKILLGVRYIHSKNIIHRDLKPSNILIKLDDDNINVKISDFGCSKIIENDDYYDEYRQKKIKLITDNSIIPSSEYIGTINYVAPEIENYEHHDFKSDIYSLGIILFELITDFNTLHEKAKKISNIHNYLKPDNDIHKLIINMIDEDPNKRYTIDDIIKLWKNKKIKKYFI
jgi:serine/threonine protein kinase